jgi:hypothetical protein
MVWAERITNRGQSEVASMTASCDPKEDEVRRFEDTVCELIFEGHSPIRGSLEAAAGAPMPVRYRPL